MLAGSRDPSAPVRGLAGIGSPWRLVLLIGLPYWLAISTVRIVSFELFASGGARVYNPVALGLTPSTRALHHLLMLVVVLAAYRLALGIGWPRERRPIAAVAHLGLGVAASLVSRPLFVLAVDALRDVHVDWLRVFMPPSAGLKLWASMSLDFLVPYFFGLALLVGVQTSVALQRSELERANLTTAWMQARLAALRMQLNPHFLFNTFNAIATLLDAQPQPARARALVVALSDLYRRTLIAAEREWMPLAEELAFAGDYLRIQAERFAGKLDYAIECGADLAGEQVPALLLQPLVENAVVHGAADDRQALSVWIRVARGTAPTGEPTMTIEVGNATDAALGSTPGAGVGLRNTRTRLAACYGGRARLETRSTEPGRFTATVTVPRSIGRKADAALAGERR